MQRLRQLSITSALVVGALTPATPRASHATCVVGHAACPAAAKASVKVTIDGVGLIPAGSNHYTTMLRVKQIGAFVAIYHTSYKGALTAHVSVDRNKHTIYRAMMSNTTRGRTYFYVWTQFRNRTQAGPLVAYLTIQTGSTKVTKELSFTLTS